MPKYGIHQIVISKAIDTLRSSSSSAQQQAGNDMNAYRGISMLGAIGPDLFFWAPDYEVVDKLKTLYDNVETVVAKYEAIVRPINDVKDAVAGAAEEVVGDLAPATVDLIRNLVEELKETSQIFEATVRTGLFAGVIAISDFISDMASLPRLTAELFDLFVPPMQNQMENQQLHNVGSWYWFDMLHYRRTGGFAQALMNQARNGSARQRAYAYGYLSHTATDVVGHGYVNQVVGGPYRLNVQRHVVVENYMDTWAFHRYYNGENVAKTLLNRLDLPVPTQLPDEIVDMLDQAFHTTYSDLYPTRLRNPGFLSKQEIRETYEIYHKVLTILQRMVVDRPEEPFSNVWEIINNALEDLLESPPSAPSSTTTCSLGEIFSFGLTSRSRDCYEEFFDQVEEWAEWLAELSLWVLETAMDIIDLILATLLSLPIATLLALLYLAQLALYQFYQLSHSILAQFGFSTPNPEDLNSTTGIASITTWLGCGTFFKYPYLRDNTKSHLVCPSGGAEGPATAPDFYNTSSDVNPTTFIENIPFDESNLESYSVATTPLHTLQLQRNRKRIGSAINFTKWMIATAANVNASANELSRLYTNWNFDSDRGYGYKTWNGMLDSTGQNIQQESFVD